MQQEPVKPPTKPRMLYDETHLYGQAELKPLRNQPDLYGLHIRAVGLSLTLLACVAKPGYWAFIKELPSERLLVCVVKPGYWALIQEMPMWKSFHCVALGQRKICKERHR